MDERTESSALAEVVVVGTDGTDVRAPRGRRAATEARLPAAHCGSSTWPPTPTQRRADGTARHPRQGADRGTRGRGTTMSSLVEYAEHVDVWAATIEDKPGALAYVLAELREAGGDLQFIIARRAEPGEGVVFVTPLRGDREITAAAQVGFNVAYSLHSVRIMGRDRPGIGAELTQKLAEGGINLRGFSASVIGTQFLAYAAVDSLDDANKVIELLEKA